MLVPRVVSVGLLCRRAVLTVMPGRHGQELMDEGSASHVSAAAGRTLGELQRSVPALVHGEYGAVCQLHPMLLVGTRCCSPPCHLLAEVTSQALRELIPNQPDQRWPTRTSRGQSGRRFTTLTSAVRIIQADYSRRLPAVCVWRFAAYAAGGWSRTPDAPGRVRCAVCSAEEISRPADVASQPMRLSSPRTMV